MAEEERAYEPMEESKPDKVSEEPKVEEVKPKKDFNELENIDLEEIELDTFLFAGGLFFYIGYKFPKVLGFLIASPFLLIYALFNGQRVWTWFKAFLQAAKTMFAFVLLVFPVIFVVVTDIVLITENLKSVTHKTLSSEWKTMKAFMILLLTILVAKEATQGLKNVFYICFIFIQKIYNKGHKAKWQSIYYLYYSFGYLFAILPGVFQICISVYIFYGCLFILGSQSDIYLVTVCFAGLAVIMSFDNFVWSFIQLMNLHWLFAKLSVSFEDEDDITDETLEGVTDIMLDGKAMFKISEFNEIVRGFYFLFNYGIIVGLIIFGEHFVITKH